MGTRNQDRLPQDKRLDLKGKTGKEGKMLPSLFGKQYGYKSQVLLPPLDKRYLKSDVLDCIWRCCGIQTQICIALDCTPRQLNAWLGKHPEAQAEMARAREGILNRAQEVILGALASKNEKTRLEAAKAVLRQHGETPAVQVNVGMGSPQAQVQAIFGIGDGAIDAELEDEEALPAD